MFDHFSTLCMKGLIAAMASLFEVWYVIFSFVLKANLVYRDLAGILKVAKANL